VRDFELFASENGFQIEHRGFLAGEKGVTFSPNLRAEVAVFLLS
jgi:hypothetical protein